MNYTLTEDLQYEIGDTIQLAGAIYSNYKLDEMADLTDWTIAAKLTDEKREDSHDFTVTIEDAVNGLCLFVLDTTGFTTQIYYTDIKLTQTSTGYVISAPTMRISIGDYM